MRKYLMTGIAAVALGGLFTACNNVDDLSGNTAEFNIMKNYEEAFITRFGQPAANQTWGFGDPVSSTRGVNANGNEWGSTYRVPPQLTAEQKDLVRQYFQQNRDPEYKDPEWTDYFIQQVYKGGTKAKGSGDDNSLTTEKYQSANNGWVVGSDHMDHLAACNADGSIKDHIYNYNFGTCSTYGNVLNTEGVKYDNVTGNYHPDEIQFMVGSTTAKFGYFNSDGSLGHTEYTGLVSWETISKWAGIYGTDNDILNDGWNRSFMGFDFEQVVGNDVYARTNEVWENNKLKSYDLVYAKCCEAPESPEYLWNGDGNTEISGNFNYTWGGNNEESFSWDNGTLVYNGKQWGGLAMWVGGQDWTLYSKLVVEFAEATSVWAQIKIDEEASGAYGESKIEFDFTNKNMSNVQQVAIQLGDPATVKISSIYLVGKGVQAYGCNDLYYKGQRIPYLSSDQNTYCGDFLEYQSDDDVKIRKYDGNTEVVCLNWKKLVDERLSQGFLPVAGSNFKKWVKVHGGADHYYSDWIVTLTEAKTISGGGGGGGGGETPTGFICRVIAEDLTVSENTDFDFNDVVFDVYANGVIRVRACGGTLPLNVDGQEVHGLFGEETGTMINTGWNGGGIDYYDTYRDIQYSGGSVADAAAANGILVEVYKKGQWWPLTAPVGEVASKIAVGEDYPWCEEREDIDSKWHLKDDTKTFSEYVKGNLPSNEWYRMVIEEAAKYQNKKNQ